MQLNFFQNTTLDAYLQLAVNARNGAGEVTVTINGESVPLTEQAQGTWTGSYEMTESGALEITVTAGDFVLTRHLVAGSAGGRRCRW